MLANAPRPTEHQILFDPTIFQVETAFERQLMASCAQHLAGNLTLKIETIKQVRTLILLQIIAKGVSYLRPFTESRQHRLRHFPKGLDGRSDRPCSIPLRIEDTEHVAGNTVDSQTRPGSITRIFREPTTIHGGASAESPQVMSDPPLPSFRRTISFHHLRSTEAPCRVLGTAFGKGPRV